ncbi:MAG TPA: hypothetical protein ENF55_04150 [Thermoprotei archaeon]|nr:MAG: hypothetical protein DRJ63_09710 [Thermoprotei archaeon]HDI75130.1 hypothetical protein [Thermoprotei archaeon]
MSIGRYEILMEFEKSGPVKAILKRHLAPITIEKFLMKLPYVSTATVMHHIVYIIMDIGVGYEKPKNRVDCGQIFYSPQNRTIGIALTDYRSLPFKINIMGVVKENSFDVLTSIERRERVKISLLD